MLPPDLSAGTMLPLPPASPQPAAFPQPVASPQPTPPLPCPHCGSSRTRGNGSFPRKDGSRLPRRLCSGCGRSFCPTTGTPLHYLKKRAEWARMVDRINDCLSVRQMARILHVHISTAFHWRHRLLGPLADQPQPALPGSVTAALAFVPYSEKGRRHRPAAPGVAKGTSYPRPFRRFIDGKPSCLLLACAGERHTLVLTSRGRPSPDQLQAALAQVLGEGAELWACGLAPYAEACRRLGVALRSRLQGSADEGGPQRWGPVDRLVRHFYTWLHRFQGVATRYLPNYLAWFRRSGRFCPRTIAAPLTC